MHISKLKDLIREAARLDENLALDGSVNWDFVSSDIHIDTDVNSEKIEKAINQVAPEFDSRPATEMFGS